MHSVNLACHTDRTRVTFKGALDMGGVCAAYDTPGEALTRALPLGLHTKELDRLDAGGVRLLLAFLREAKARRLALRWRSVSPAITASAELLGLSNALELRR